MIYKKKKNLRQIWMNDNLTYEEIHDESQV